MKKLFGLITILMFVALFSQQTKAQDTAKDIDGNVYETVTIGNQVWIAENLRVSRFNNGDFINEVTNKKDLVDFGKNNEPFWMAYDYDVTFVDTYGKLYSWDAAADDRGLCPIGWRLPSVEDWKELRISIGKSHTLHLKEAGTNHWITSEGVTNNTGFTALPGGRCARFGGCEGVGIIGQWWSNKKQGRHSAWAVRFKDDADFGTWEFLRKNFALSVRCIKE